MKENIKKKTSSREDKLVLDSNYSLTHPINKALIKQYLNPKNCNHTGNKYFTNRLHNMFSNRVPIGGKDLHQYVKFPIGMIETKKGPKPVFGSKTKLIKHLR